MNDDLISREQCIAMILNTPTQNRHEDVLSALALRQVEIINVIERCPAVAPVRHGRWIIGFENFSPYQKCSTCGLEIPLKATEGDMEICLYRFCPNCGARMDQEEEA